MLRGKLHPASRYFSEMSATCPAKNYIFSAMKHMFCPVNVTSASRCAVLHLSSAYRVERVFWLAKARLCFFQLFKLRSVRLETARGSRLIESMEIDATFELLHYSWEFKVFKTVDDIVWSGLRKMRLRSRNILNENPQTPSRRRRAAPETPRPQTPLIQNQVSPALLNTRYEKKTKVACVWCDSALWMICAWLVSMMLTDL